MRVKLLRLSRAMLLFCLGLALCGCRTKKPAPVATHKPIYKIDMGDDSSAGRLLRGFYGPNGEWRWASRAFAVSLDLPAVAGATYLELDFDYPKEVANEHPSVAVQARVNGVEVCKEKYNKGRHALACLVPQPALKKAPATIEFETDQSVRQPDGRDLALIVVSIELMDYEQTSMYRGIEMQRAREAYNKVLEAHRKTVPPNKAREMMRLFHDLPVWQSLWFENVPIIKNPLDLWMMQQIIYEVRPDYVIETGTWKGGSALFWAYVLHGLGLEKSKVITIDIQRTHEVAATNPLWKRYVEFILGSSTDAKVVEQIAQQVKGSRVIVTLDSDHTMRHVLKEMQSYAPLINAGSYLVVEDTHIDGIPTNLGQGAGPMAAVRRFLEEGGSKDFEQDFSREALLMTFNPGGWLRRK